MQASHARFLHKAFVFHVDRTIKSSATRVVFNNSHLDMQGVCLKMWLACQNEIYNTGDLEQRAAFLVEGLEFNRQFSGNICYGIVPVLHDEPDELTCGPLIEEPVLEHLLLKRPYALVMKRLKDEWRLDKQLQSDKLGNLRGMEFLADQVATMHRQLERSSPKFGTPERIADKLEFNIEQFGRALDARSTQPQTIVIPAFDASDIRRLSKAYRYDFKKRQSDGYIKRCHGDLKASNLWVCPFENESRAQEHLVALDCVDFNPEFCNIDTLSDVAMLAVDLEMQLDNDRENYSERLSGEQLARHFLQAYLAYVGENETVWPLLEFYMMEKAMVCAYMSIVYDNSPALGERYLTVVLAHSQELLKYLPPHVGKRITRPLHLIAS